LMCESETAWWERTGSWLSPVAAAFRSTPFSAVRTRKPPGSWVSVPARSRPSARGSVEHRQTPPPNDPESSSSSSSLLAPWGS
jgi:hypothetical protein